MTDERANFRRSALSKRGKLGDAVCVRALGPAVAATTTSQRGSWAPSLLCTVATHAVFRVPLSVAVGKLSLWVASPGVLSQPPASLGRFLGRRPFLAFHHCLAGRRPLTHSPRREVVSGPAHTRGAHPTASGRHAMSVSAAWDASPGSESSLLFRIGSGLFGLPALQLTNGGVVHAVVPCGP